MTNDPYTPESGIVLVPDSVRQLGDYELDLMKFIPSVSPFNQPK